MTPSISRDSSGEIPKTANDADDTARNAADRLAIALEEAGFDVGRDFMGLTHCVDASGTPWVGLGPVTPDVSTRLTELLLRPEGSRCSDGEHWT